MNQKNKEPNRLQEPVLPPAFIDAVLQRDFAAVSRWCVAERAANRACRTRSSVGLELMSLIQAGMYADEQE